MTLRKQQSGQGMMEAVVAIGIILTSIVLIISLSIATTQYGTKGSKRNLAINFAREGIEAVRHIRDSNWLAGRAFSSGLFNPTRQTGIARWGMPWQNVYFIQWDFGEFGPDNCYIAKDCICYVNRTPACNLRHNPDGTYSNYGSGTDTDYRRLVFLKPLDEFGVETNVEADIYAIQVVSQVHWVERGIDEFETIETRIYDWQTNNP
ncbi:hypothetical protein ACFL04_01400 [Patescibacteria group bacterium]